MKKRPIDTAWFLKRMESLELSMHTVAARMTGRNGKLDYSSMHKLINGGRSMSLLEAVELAEILEAPVDVIAKKALGRGR